MSMSLFVRIGGEAAVEAAVNRFYDKLLKNEDILPFFQHISMEDQKQKVRTFFTQVMGGPCDTTPKDMRVAHAPLVNDGLNDHHVDIFVVMMRETMEELNIPDELISEFIDICESFRDDVLNRESVKAD